MRTRLKMENVLLGAKKTLKKLTSKKNKSKTAVYIVSLGHNLIKSLT
jgi:hypothetical protein